MMINPVQFNNIRPVSFQGNKERFSAQKADTFEKTWKVKTKYTPFSGEKDYQEYIKTPKFLRDVLDSTLHFFEKDAAKESVRAACALKEQYYSDCNPDEICFVSIGTSPVGVMRAFEYMGYDVKYIPISNLWRFGEAKDESTIGEYADLPNNKSYFNFLKSIGLDKDKINNGDKKYIFYDYTSLGTTLGYIRDIAYHKGLDPEKVEFRSINVDLMSSITKKNRRAIGNYISYYMCGSNMDSFSNVPHIDYTKTIKIIDDVKRKEKFRESSFNKALCHKLDRMGLLK